MRPPAPTRPRPGSHGSSRRSAREGWSRPATPHPCRTAPARWWSHPARPSSGSGCHPRPAGPAGGVLASGGPVERLGLHPGARVVGGPSAGVPPHLMGLGPVPATTKLLSRLGLGVADLDAVELNEAFAAQVLACVRRLGLDEATVNADGGAIALGHPLGSSGCPLLGSLLR